MIVSDMMNPNALHVLPFLSIRVEIGKHHGCLGFFTADNFTWFTRTSLNKLLSGTWILLKTNQKRIPKQNPNKINPNSRSNLDRQAQSDLGIQFQFCSI